MIKKLAHIGLVVKNLEQAIDFYNSMFQFGTSPLIEEKEFTVGLIDVDNVKLELMAPVGNKGTLARFLEKRGEGIHHICFEVDDIDASIKSLSARGVELVDKEPQLGVEGRIVFLHPRSTHGVLIELVEKVN